MTHLNKLPTLVCTVGFVQLSSPFAASYIKTPGSDEIGTHSSAMAAVAAPATTSTSVGDIEHSRTCNNTPRTPFTSMLAAPATASASSATGNIGDSEDLGDALSEAQMAATRLKATLTLSKEEITAALSAEFDCPFFSDRSGDDDHLKFKSDNLDKPVVWFYTKPENEGSLTTPIYVTRFDNYTASIKYVFYITSASAEYTVVFYHPEETITIKNKATEKLLTEGADFDAIKTWTQKGTAAHYTFAE